MKNTIIKIKKLFFSNLAHTIKTCQSPHNTNLLVTKQLLQEAELD
jgi:hypothetical protein